MELHHARALLLERADQVERERFDVAQGDRAVGGAAVRGRRVVLLGAERPARAEEELHLVAAAELDAVIGQAVEHPPGERPRAARIRLALLVELIDRRERPAGARRERRRLGGIGQQARVAGRAADVRRGRDLVVDLEDREDGGQADPVRRRFSKRRSGIVFTSVTPEFRTIARATASTPSAARRRAVSFAAVFVDRRPSAITSLLGPHGTFPQPERRADPELLRSADDAPRLGDVFDAEPDGRHEDALRRVRAAGFVPEQVAQLDDLFAGHDARGDRRANGREGASRAPRRR